MDDMFRPTPLLLLMVALISYTAGEEKRVVCYYTNWSVYRPGTAKFSPQNINPYLCTHLIYAFGGLDKDNGLRPYDKYQDIEQGGYAKFTGLKTYNKNLKTMLAIGGWNEGSARFSPLVADEERRKEFVRNVVKFLRQNHFDGLDLDWEYPAFRDGGKPRDRDNYAHLVQELREEFERESSKTGRTRLLLTMAVPAGIEYIDKGYDIPKLNRYLDFMNILSYDYHSAFEPAVNHHSPLYPLEEDDEYNFDAELSIDYTIKHYLKLGADRDKLVLGIPTYGRSYTLFNADSTALGSPSDGPGEQGEATREKGYLAYYEICQSLNNEKDWKIEQPKLGAMGPYAFKDKQWVGYDDAFIVKEKAKYVNDKNLGGIMFWSIDNDDFRGKCHDRPYPLIEAGKEMLFGTSGKSSSKNNIASSSQPESKTVRPVNPLQRRPGQKSSKPKSSIRTTTAAATTRQTTANPLTTPEPPTTPDPGSDFVCKDEGFFPHPRDCKKYFWCLDSGPSNLGIVAHQFTCPSGLFFNKAADSCDFARNVLCKDKKDKTTTTSKPTSTTQQTTTASSRNKFTAATAKSTGNRYTTTTTTTTTTTEAPPDDEEEDAEGEDDYHAEEDPQTIKQLITLIKKLGGVAELEKQLENNGGSDVTTAPISKTLYNKVLTPGKFQSPYRNGPSGPQNEGLPPANDDSPYSRREKPQYVTIRRERPSTNEPEENVRGGGGGGRGEEVVEEEQEEGEEVESETERVRPIKPLYSSIQRRRPSTESSESTSPTTAATRSKYSSIQRSRPSTLASDSGDTTTSRYVTLQRHRPQQQLLNVDDDVIEDDHVSPLPFVRSRPQEEEESDVATTTTTQKTTKKVSDEATEIRPVYDRAAELSATTTTTSTTTPSAVVDDNILTSTPLSTTTTQQTDIKNDTSTEQAANKTSTETAPIESASVISNNNNSNDSFEDNLNNREIPIVKSVEQTTPVPYQTSTITSIVTVIVEGATERQRVALNKLEELLAEHDVTSAQKVDPPKSIESSGLANRIAPTLKSNRTVGQVRNIPRRRFNAGKASQDTPTTEPYRPSIRRLRPTEASTTSSPVEKGTRFIPSRSRNRTVVAPATSEDVRPRTRDFRRRPTEDSTDAPKRNSSRTRSRFSGGFRSSTQADSSTPSNDEDVSDEAAKLNEVSSTRPRNRFSIARVRGTTSTTSTTTSSPPARQFYGRSRSRLTTVKPDSNQEQTSGEQLVNSTNRLAPRQRANTFYAPIQRTSNNQYLTNQDSSRNDSSEILIQMENTNVLTKSNKTRSKDEKIDLNKSIEKFDGSVENLKPSNGSITSNSSMDHEDSFEQSINDSIGSASGNSQEVSKEIESYQETSYIPPETTTVIVSTAITETKSVENVTDSIEGTNRNSNSKLNKQRGSSKFSITDSAEEDVSKSIEASDSVSNERSNIKDSGHRGAFRSRSKFNVENFDRHKSSAKSRDISQSDHDDRVFLDSVDENGVRKRKKVVRLLPRNRNIINDTATTREGNGRRIVTVVRSRNSPGRNSNGRDDEYFETKSERPSSTARSNSQRNTNRNNVESRSNSRSRYEEVTKKEENSVPESGGRSRGRIRFKMGEDDGNVDDLGSNVDKRFEIRKKSRLESEKADENLRKTTTSRSRVTDKSNGNNIRDKPSRRSRLNSEDLETGQSGRVSKKVDDESSFENSVSSGVSKKSSSVSRNRGSIRAKQSLKDEVDDNDVEDGGSGLERSTFSPEKRGEIRHRESETNDIAVETETNSENTRIRIVPVRRVVSRSRSTTTEPTTTYRDNFSNSRRLTSRTRLKEGATTSRLDPTSSQQTDSEGYAVTTLRPRKFTFPKRLARPSTTLEQPAAEEPRTTPRPFDSQEESTNSGLPDLADVAVAAIQALATVPPSTFESASYSTPAPLFPRRTSTVQTIIHHTVPVSSLGTGSSPQAVTAVSSSTLRTTPSLLQSVTHTHRAVPRPFSKKRISTSSPPPKPAYITKGRTKQIEDVADYEVDYYAEPVDVPLSGKVRIHNDGYIECLDVGNFPHPFSCRKFISCAKMETEHLLGWEYTCPRGLSFDPIGGICNWSAGLGCKE